MNNNGICVNTKTAIIIGAIFVGAVIFGAISRNKSAEYQKTMKHYVEVVIPAGRAYGDSMAKIAEQNKKTADSISAVAESRRRNIKKLSDDIAVLHVQNKALAEAALSDTNTPPTARAAIIGLQNEVDSLNRIIIQFKELDADNKLAIVNLTNAYNGQKIRADSLDNLLNDVPAPPGPATVLGLKMPRLPSWVGYTAVAVGGYYIGTKVNK